MERKIKRQRIHEGENALHDLAPYRGVMQDIRAAIAQITGDPRDGVVGFGILVLMIAEPFDVSTA